MSKYSETIPPDINGAVGWLMGYIRPKTRLMDVGCSTGYFGGFIKNNNHIMVDGVEISDDAIEAKTKLDKVYSFDLDAVWPKLDYKYDYIFFGDVLEHLKSPEKALIQAAKILKDDGLIFISIPNIAHISIRLELLRGNFRYEPTGILDNTHLQYFTKESFIDISRKAGFEPELVDYTENDMPKEMITEYLNNAGLSAKSKFWNNINNIESRAYQFKFILRRSPSSHIKRNTNSNLLDKPLHYRDDYISNFQVQLDAIHKHADEQAVIIQYYKDKSDALLKEVERQNLVINKPLRNMVHNYANRINKRSKGI